MNLNRTGSSQVIIVLLLIIAGMLFQFAMMRDGHGWGDDFAQYIHHAKNISEGNDYSNTGYIFNPLAPTYAPQNYPPGFPLILATVYSFTGINYDAFHIVLIFFYAWFLWLIWLLLKDRLKFSSVLISIALVAFSPAAWALTDEVVADLPAACFALLFFYVLRKRYRLKANVFIISSALTAYVSFACRAPGILLMPAAFIVSVMQTKKIDKHLLYAMLLFFVLAGLQSLFISNEHGYFEMLRLGLNGKQNILNHFAGMANSYFQSLKDIIYFGNGEHTNLSQFFGTFLFVLFIAGFYLQSTKNFGAQELFFILNFLVLIIFPGFQGLRYLTPVIPFYFFYVFKTLETVNNKVSISFIVLVLIFFPVMYVQFYRTIPDQWDPYRMQGKEITQTFDFISENIPDDAVIMATKPRALALFTDVRATVFPDDKFKTRLDENIRSLQVDFVLTSYIDKYAYPKMVVQDQLKYEMIFENEKFGLYKIKQE